MKNLHNALQLKQLYQLKILGYSYTDAKLFSPDSHKVELPNSLKELKAQAQKCHLCQLSKRRESVIFGEGSSRAEVMIIGDFPIKGSAEEMLRLMIEKVLGLSKEKVYITHLLKCHIPNWESEALAPNKARLKSSLPNSSLESEASAPNKTKLHKEIQSCKIYLSKEIELIKPKLIITLGELPYQHLTDSTTPLKEIRGTVTTQEGFKLLPTYHPNFLLKNPSFKRAVFTDLKRAKEFISKR